MERKFTDAEIVEALENCSDGSGKGIIQATIDLIKRQKAEIERLTSAVDNSTKEFLKLHDEQQKQKAEIEKNGK